MATQICPECGCKVMDGGYEKEGVMFCCEPCATGEECECGCCREVPPGEEQKGCCG